MNAVVKQGETLPVAAAPSPANVLEIISRAASDPTIDVAKVEKLLDLHERIVKRDQETAFNEALNHAQAKVSRVGADATNPQTRSRYASYPALDRALRPIWTELGFSLSFDTADATQPEYIRVVCHVSHRAGHTRTYHVDMPADGKGAKGGDVMTKTHAAGSALSYGMRYLLKMIFNVAVGEDDDDGNAAGAACVTEKQAADLRALATEVGADVPRFLKYIGAEDFEKIPAARFDSAVEALKRKARS